MRGCEERNPFGHITDNIIKKTARYTYMQIIMHRIGDAGSSEFTVLQPYHNTIIIITNIIRSRDHIGIL